jgi:hypothetical protein
MALRELIEREKPVCLVIDPIYLAMDGSKSRSLFAMGAMLRPLAELCESTGCAILVVHHAKRSHKVGQPPTLDEIAWSGFAEFSAQWLLVSRRRPYDPDTGHHELWLSAGGRAGHHGLWALDVDEGATAPLPDNGPITLGSQDQRTWKTTLRSFAWAEAQADEQFVATGEDRRRRRRAIAVDRQSQRVLELLAASPEGRTARFMRDVLGLSGDRISRVLDALIAKGAVVKTEERYDRRRMIVTYSRVPMMDLSEAAIKAGGVTPRDEKTYDAVTGRWGNAPAPAAAGVGGGGTLRPAARGICNESTGATGRDTQFDRENSGNLAATQAGRDAASNVPSHPAPAAPGAEASRLRDTLIDREQSRDLAAGRPEEPSCPAVAGS